MEKKLFGQYICWGFLSFTKENNISSLAQLKTLKNSIFVLYTDENYFEPRIWTIKVVMLILLGKNSDLFGNEYFVLDLWLYINYVNI